MEYNYGPSVIAALNQKRVEDMAQNEKNRMMEPNLVAALTALVSGGLSEGAMSGGQPDWSKFSSPTALSAGLRAGLQPTMGNGRDVLTGFGSVADVRKEQEAKQLAENERLQKQLMEILQRRQDLLKEFEISSPEDKGATNVGQYLPGIMPENTYIKRKSPLEQMLQNPQIGPAVMKALGVSQGQTGPFKMYNPKTKEYGTADTVEDIAEGNRQGFQLIIEGK